MFCSKAQMSSLPNAERARSRVSAFVSDDRVRAVVRGQSRRRQPQSKRFKGPKPAAEGCVLRRARDNTTRLIKYYNTKRRSAVTDLARASRHVRCRAATGNLSA